MSRTLSVQLERQVADALQHRRPDQAGRLGRGDVDVVAALRLGRRREDGLRQARGLGQSGRQAHAAHFARGLVVLPAGPSEVSARHALNRQRLGPAHEHGAAAQQVGVLPGAFRVVGGVRRQQMVRNDRGQTREPEERDLRQDAALVRDAGSEHVVEGGDSIGRDDHEAIAEVVDVAHLAVAIRSAAGERSLEHRGGERQKASSRESSASYREAPRGDNNNM